MEKEPTSAETLLLWLLACLCGLVTMAGAIAAIGLGLCGSLVASREIMLWSVAGLLAALVGGWGFMACMRALERRRPRSGASETVTGRDGIVRHPRRQERAHDDGRTHG